MRRLTAPRGKPLTFELDGEPIPAHEGETIATALLAAGVRVFSRSAKYHRPRGPFCLAGACIQCLMRVDGVPDVATCRTKVRAGMRVERQNAYPSAKVDVLGTIDWLFPHGMDHHAMFAGVPVAEKVMVAVARHLAGLGYLPDKAIGERMPCETLRARLAVAGAGAAGSAAADALADGGADFVAFEKEEMPGGRLALGPLEPDAPKVPSRSWDGRLRLATAAIGLYDDEEGRYFAAVQSGPEGPRLVKAYADQFLVATGAHAALLPFEDNDLPGIYAATAASRLVRREGLLCGEEIALVGSGPLLYSTARLLEDNGAKLAIVVDVKDAPPSSLGKRAAKGTELRAHGHSKVNELSFRPETGRRRRVDCDAVVVASPPSPAFELARQGGANVSYSPEAEAFLVEADADGRTAAKGIFVAGQLARSPMTAKESAQSGRRAAAAMLGEAK